MAKVLLDSGASKTVVNSDLVKKLKKHKNTSKTVFNTPGGRLVTTSRCKVLFRLTELNASRVIEWECQVNDSKEPTNYDMIIGRDLLEELGINLKFNTGTIEWDEAQLPMRDPGVTQEQMFLADDAEGKLAVQASERLKAILDAKYEKANLDHEVNKCAHLTTEQQESLLELLQKYEHLFDGTLGKWKSGPYEIHLKEGAQPFHARACPIPKIHERTLRDEVDRLVKIGVLRKVNRSEWAAPTFIIPKTDMTVRFISDFRELNKRIQRKPFPIPNISDMLMKMEGFQFATSLDLNMGYYHIELTPNSSRLCTIVLPWGKYEYVRLPMGLCNSPDIFQEKMSELMAGLEFVRVYIDDLLVVTTGDWKDHLQKLSKVFDRLSEVGLKVNIKKSSFGQSQVEHLGHLITRDGIKPIPKKVEAILRLSPPKTKKQLRRFIGMVNFYRDMWQHRSETLAPLCDLTSVKAKWKWTEVHQKSFDKMKQIIARKVMLSFPQFDKPFHIHTDASDQQLGAVISQEGIPIAFYSRKLNPAQKRYDTIEKELLSVVETLKEYENILLGHHVVVHTDHKNLTYQKFNTKRVMKWRLLIEEFHPELHHIQGDRNVVADALSRLDFAEGVETQQMEEMLAFDEDDLPEDHFPLTYEYLQKTQQQDKNLINNVKTDPSFAMKDFRGGGKTFSLICKNGKIVIPSHLTNRVLTWYHQMLMHPGATRTEQTIRHHLHWKGMRNDVKELCKKCPVCQLNKRHYKKYGHLPEKEAESEPWDKLCVDLIGPCSMKRKGKPTLTLWCVTMIDPATNWIEIREIPDRRADTIANIIEQAWFTRCPWPTQINIDRGSEFMAEFAKMVRDDCGIKRKPITTRNPQANSMIERAHQTIANIIRTVSRDDLDESDPWSGVLAATMFALRATHHTTLQASPMQLVFGRDAILNLKFSANWQFIKEQKQKLIHKNNQNENAKRIPHCYKVGDRVLVDEKPMSKYDPKYSGPFRVCAVNNNGTLKIKKNAYFDTINIRNVYPFHS